MQMLQMRCQVCKKPLQKGDHFRDNAKTGTPMGICKKCHEHLKPFYGRKK